MQRDPDLENTDIGAGMANKPDTVEIHLSDSTQALDNESQSDWSSSKWLNGSRFLAFPAKATVAREWISRQKQGLRPWREFLRSDKFKIPSGPGVVGRRLYGNLTGFQANYLCIFLVLAAYCLITTPLLLLAVAASIGFVYFLRARSQEGRLVVGGKEISPTMQYGAGIGISLSLLYISGAGAALFWTIGATVVVVLAHALFYASEPRPGAEFEMEQV